MADATLTDVVKKLEEVKSAVTAGDKVTGTASAKAEEAGAEKSRKDAELKKIFEAIRDKLGLKNKEKDKEEEDDISYTSGLLAALSGAASGIVAGLTLGFINFYKSIFALAGKGFAKMFPNITKTLSGIFGKGGTISKFFMSIKAFFTESKAFKAISEGFTKFKTMLSNFGKTVMKFVNPIIDSFKPIMKLFSAGGKGLGATFKTFTATFKHFFGIFKGFFAKLFYPIQIIISLIDGFFEAKDAVDKSEGMLATFFNSIVGFFGGILDGLIFGMLDLIKDGIAWVAGFLGFKDVEKFLDSFSFSAMFNEFLDDVYKWFNLLFSDPVAALTSLVSNYFGAALSVGDFIVDMIKKPIAWLLGLFGWDEAADQVSTFSFSGTVKKVFDSALTWITSLFNDPIKTLTDLLKTYFGAYLTVADFIVNMIKKPIAWVLGLFGWDEAADEVEAFSLKDTVMKAVTAIGKWFGNMFDKITNFDFTTLAKSLMPDFLADLIFGTGETKIEKPEGMSIKDFEEEQAAFAAKADESFGGVNFNIVDTIAKSMLEMFPEKIGLFDFRSRIAEQFVNMGLLESYAKGGVIDFTGPAMVHGTKGKPEFMLDNQAAAVFMKAAQMLTGSQMLEQSRMGGGGGQPVIINNNNVDNSVKSSSRQNISVPESTRTNESTLRALQMAA